MEVPECEAGPSPSDFSLSWVFSGLSGSEFRNEEKREATMLSAMVLGPVPEQWLGAGQDGHPQLPDATTPRPTHLGPTAQPCTGVGLGNSA